MSTVAKEPGQQKWWKENGPAVYLPPRPTAGQSCPKCCLADLDYDTLFRLSCPVCGFIAECGAFT